MKIVSEGGDKEKIKQKMSEYLSKVYDEDVKVDDFKLLKGSREDTLDITLIGARQSNGYQGKDNRNLGIHEHIDEYNKNGVFFSEKKDITISRYLGSGGAKTEEVDERGAIVPIKGTIYSNSTEYYITSNLSERDLNYIKESWKLENKDKLLKLEKSLKENDEKIRRLKSSLKINGEKITISGLNLDAVLKKGKNGRIIATVSDNLNLLNKRENQLIIEQYRKAGIDIKNNLLSEIIVENNRQAMKQSSVNYDEEFIDGKEVESRGKFYTGTSVIGGQVVYAASAYRSENLKNSKISSSENTDEESAFKGGYRKKPINEELHRKINERGEGYYYKLYRKKKGYTGTVWDKIKATTENKVKHTIEIPATFELEVSSGKIWVNANASEHLGEKVKNYIKRNPMASPEKIKLVEQLYLESYIGKIEKITKNGIPLNKPKTEEGWGFEFSKNEKDKYPVLIHSQPNQK